MSTETKEQKFEGRVSGLVLADLQESKFNPRKNYPKDEIAELAESIKRAGVLSPILVRPLKDESHEIIYGHRRARAAKLAGLVHIPAIIREMDDDQAMEAQVIENLQRKDILPMEEARGYSMLTKRGKQPPTVQDLAVRFGKSASYIRSRLQLLKLIPKAQEMLEDDTIQLTVAIELSKLVEGMQVQALKQMRESDSPQEQISDIRNMAHKDLKDAKFDPKDATLVEKAGPCTTCPHRAGMIPDLFNDVKADTCTLPGCFKKKTEAFYARFIEEEKKKGVKVLTGEAAETQRNNSSMVKLLETPGYEYPSEARKKNWKTWLGSEGMKELKDSITLLVLRGRYSSDPDIQTALVISKASAINFLKKKKVKWASAKKTNDMGQPVKSAKQKAKEAATAAIMQVVKCEALRRAGELAVEAFSKKVPKFVLELLKNDIENNSYMDDTDEKTAIAAFGETAQSAAKSYKQPWDSRRMEKLPAKDLVRLWGIVQMLGVLPSQIHNGNKETTGKWCPLVNVDLKKMVKKVTKEYNEMQAKAAKKGKS